jgi:Tfp pilus assembly protein FimT
MKKLIGLAAVAAIAVPTTALGAASRSTSGTVWAHITHTAGGFLYVSGDISDRVLGKGAIVYLTKPSSQSDGTILVKATKITIFTPGGSLTGSGQATQTITGSTSTVSNGTFSLTKGTGTLKGKTMKGTFKGTQDDQQIYTFKYTGKLKG